MKNLIITLLVLGLVGCASIPTNTQNGQGRLLVFSKVNYEGGTGPWWNYQIYAKNRKTEERVIININVNKGVKMHLSRDIPPGTYDLYEWNSVSKNTSKAFDHDISGMFVIKENAITVFDKELVVTVTPKNQSFNFKDRDQYFKERKVVTLTQKEKALSSWEIYWQRSPTVRW